MPIYEYRCLDCDRSFETLVTASFPQAECPKCHGANLARELSVFASARGGNGGGSAQTAPRGGGCCGGGCACCAR